MIIRLMSSDPVVSRANALEAGGMSEVGFIPGDEYGCKIYAQVHDGITTLLGIHSRTYGCHQNPQTVGVEVVPSRIHKLDSSNLMLMAVAQRG